MTTVEVPITELRKGDAFYDGPRLVWTALEDARLIDAPEPSDYGPKWVEVLVQHEPDGGIDYRRWDDPSLSLPVMREADSLTIRRWHPDF